MISAIKLNIPTSEMESAANSLQALVTENNPFVKIITQALKTSLAPSTEQASATNESELAQSRPAVPVELLNACQETESLSALCMKLIMQLLQPEEKTDGEPQVSAVAENVQDVNPELLAWMQQLAANIVDVLEGLKMARMPQDVPKTGWNQEVSQLVRNFIEANPCPLENGNDLEKINAIKTAEPSPAAPQKTDEVFIGRLTEAIRQALGDRSARQGSSQENMQQQAPPADAFGIKKVSQAESSAEPLTAVFAQHAPVASEGVQQTKAAADVNRALQAEDIMRQVVDSIKSSVADGQQKLEIQLKPEHLGKMSLQLVMGESGLVAKIITASSEVQGAIAQQMLALKETLSQQGIKVADINVVYQQTADMTGQSKRQMHYEEPKSAHPLIAINRERSAERLLQLDPYGMSNISSLDPQISSVEYRA